MVVDYCALNKQTIKNINIFLKIDNLFDQMVGAQILILDEDALQQHLELCLTITNLDF